MKRSLSLAFLALVGMSGPVPPQANAQTVINTVDYVFQETNGFLLQNPANPTDVTDMHMDPATLVWVWVATTTRTADDILTNGGIQGIAIDYIEGAYAPGNMAGVQRNVGSDNNGSSMSAYVNPNSGNPGHADFPPNTMPLAMNLPVLQPWQMATTSVTPGAVMAFNWEPMAQYQISPGNCGVQSGPSVIYTRNSFYLVQNLAIGWDVGTPALTLIMETEQTTNPSLGTLRIERYAFAPGFGRVWMEQAMDTRTPQYNGARTTWAVKVPNYRGHLVGPLCP